MAKIVAVNPKAKSAETLYYVYTQGKPVCYAGTNTPAEFTRTEAHERLFHGDYSSPPAPKAKGKGVTNGDD